MCHAGRPAPGSLTKDTTIAARPHRLVRQPFGQRISTRNKALRSAFTDAGLGEHDGPDEPFYRTGSFSIRCSPIRRALQPTLPAHRRLSRLLSHRLRRSRYRRSLKELAVLR